MPDPGELLYDVFEYLRRNRVPLGVSEYLTAMMLIQDGTILSRDDLRSACRLLWAKSVHDQQMFDTAYTRLGGAIFTGCRNLVCAR